MLCMIRRIAVHRYVIKGAYQDVSVQRDKRVSLSRTIAWLTG